MPSFSLVANTGRAAEAFLDLNYPEHHRIQAFSFEEMFEKLASDLARRQRSRPIHVPEIVIVTHANADGNTIVPLVRGAGIKASTVFNVENLSTLQEQMRSGMHKKFREARRRVAMHITEDTSIVVRGCNLGESQEAIDALRIFFGGRVRTGHRVASKAMR